MELIKKGEEIDKKLTTIIDVIIDLRNSVTKPIILFIKNLRNILKIIILYWI